MSTEVLGVAVVAGAILVVMWTAFAGLDQPATVETESERATSGATTAVEVEAEEAPPASLPASPPEEALRGPEPSPPVAEEPHVVLEGVTAWTPAPPVEVSAPPVEVEPPPVEVSAPPVEVSVPSVEVPVPSVEVSAPPVEVPVPSVEVPVPSVEVPAPPVEVEPVRPWSVPPPGAGSVTPLELDVVTPWRRIRSGILLMVLLALVGAMLAGAVAAVLVFAGLALRRAVS